LYVCECVCCRPGCTTKTQTTIIITTTRGKTTTRERRRGSYKDACEVEVKGLTLPFSLDYVVLRRTTHELITRVPLPLFQPSYIPKATLIIINIIIIIMVNIIMRNLRGRLTFESAIKRRNILGLLHFHCSVSASYHVFTTL